MSFFSRGPGPADILAAFGQMVSRHCRRMGETSGRKTLSVRPEGTFHKARNALSDESGATNIAGIMMLGISMIFLAIGFIFLPITTNAAASLLDYSYSANSSGNVTMDAAMGWPISDATFTGYTSVVGITPLLILVGFLVAAVITGMLGVKVMKSGSGSADPGALMLIGLSIVFIGIGLIIEPVMLDGVSSVVHGDGAGISTSFTGYSAIVLVSPMLVHIGYLIAAVFSGFFGIKKLASSSG